MFGVTATFCWVSVELLPLSKWRQFRVKVSSFNRVPSFSLVQNNRLFLKQRELWILRNVGVPPLGESSGQFILLDYLLEPLRRVTIGGGWSSTLTGPSLSKKVEISRHICLLQALLCQKRPLLWFCLFLCQQQYAFLPFFLVNFEILFEFNKN